MKKDQIYIVGKYSAHSDEVIALLKRKSLKFYPEENYQDMNKLVIDKIKEGSKNFVICGGDGTINKFVSIVMKLPEKVRGQIKISLVPCGRANDLAKNLGISLDLNGVLKTMGERKFKKIDLIKVNNDYIVTGGGFGLPVEVIENMEKSSGQNSFFSGLFKGFAYYLFVLKLIILGHVGVKYRGDELMALCILNQSFMGKKFNLFPKSKNDDGKFEVCIVGRGKGKIEDFKIIRDITKGTYFDNRKNKVSLHTKMKLFFEKEQTFMGDGEILSRGRIFLIEILPKALSFAY